MELDQYVCLDEILHKFENGSCPVKNWVTSSNVKKKKKKAKISVLSRGHIFSPVIMKPCQNVCLHEISY